MSTKHEEAVATILAAIEKKKAKGLRTPKEELANTFLAPAIEWAAARGNKTRIAELMTKHYGPVSRQQVAAWLSESPDTRQQPTLGNTLAMLLCIAELQTQDATAQ